MVAASFVHMGAVYPDTTTEPQLKPNYRLFTVNIWYWSWIFMLLIKHPQKITGCTKYHVLPELFGLCEMETRTLFQSNRSSWIKSCRHRCLLGWRPTVAHMGQFLSHRFIQTQANGCFRGITEFHFTCWHTFELLKHVCLFREITAVLHLPLFLPASNGCSTDKIQVRVYIWVICCAAGSIWLARDRGMCIITSNLGKESAGIVIIHLFF